MINFIVLLLVCLTNCSPAVKNGGRNGIHHQRQAPKQYKEVHNNYENNNKTQFKFKLTITMLFSYGSGQKQIGNNKKCRAGESLVISIAMWMRRYNVGHIARWSTSRASIEATGCCHRASARIASPQRPPWLKNLLKQH